MQQKLVYYEHTFDVEAAYARERQLKGWRGSKKDALVSSMNPEWLDLLEEYCATEKGSMPTAVKRPAK